MLPRIIAISGSIRKTSNCTAVLRTIADAAQDVAEIMLFPLDEIPLYNGDDDGERKPAPVALLRRAIADSDGVIVCSPEYNYGISGVLKNAIDWVSRPAFQSPLRYKPVLIMTASPASTGGVRAQQQMRETFAATLSHVVARPEVVISAVAGKIADGRLVDAAALDIAIAAVADLVLEIAHRSPRGEDDGTEAHLPAA